MPERSPVTDTAAKFGLLLFNLLLGVVLLGDLWGLHSSEPLIPALKGWWPGMTPTFYMWVRVALGLFMLGLLTVILFRARQWRKEEREYKSLQSTITKLQKELTAAKASLTAIEDKRPLLKAEPFPTQRTLRHNLYSGVHHLSHRAGFFALLRVTNEPDNLNSSSIAHHIHARITYCDEQWKPLFHTVDGIWFDLDWDHDPINIGSPRSEPESLSPHKSVYLGVALRYQWEGAPYHALCAESQKCPDWLNPEFKLSRENTYLQISITCHGFQKDCGYILTSPDSQQGFQLERVDLPV